MLQVSLQIKLITIVLLALMNMLLLKRKKSDNDTVESYMLEGAHSHNIKNNDKKPDDDSSDLQYQYTQKFIDIDKDLDQIIKVTDNKNRKSSENLLFVRMQKPKKSDHSIQGKQYQNNPLKMQISSSEKQIKKSEPSVRIEQQQSAQSAQSNKNQTQDAQIICNANQQIVIPPLFIPMQQEKNESQFQEIPLETKSDHKSNSKSFKQLPRTKPFNNLYTQRKFTQNKLPYQPQSESESITKKTQINIRKKQKSLCINQCQCSKNSHTPRQTLKRCLQDLIYNTFQEMIEKDTIEQYSGQKKKKRSL